MARVIRDPTTSPEAGRTIAATALVRPVQGNEYVVCTTGIGRSCGEFGEDAELWRSSFSSKADARLPFDAFRDTVD